MINRYSFVLQSTSGDGNLGPENNNAAALPLEHRSGGGYDVGLPLSSGGPLQGPHDDTWPLQAVPDAVKIKHLQVQCEKTHMRVNIEFDRPFYGVIFSKGAYFPHNMSIVYEHWSARISEWIVCPLCGWGKECVGRKKLIERDFTKYIIRRASSKYYNLKRRHFLPPRKHL